MRADFQRHHGVPVGILAGVCVTGAAVPDAEDARQQEILETAVGEAVRPGMPAEAVEGNGVRCDPSPAHDSRNLPCCPLEPETEAILLSLISMPLPEAVLCVPCIPQILFVSRLVLGAECVG